MPFPHGLPASITVILNKVNGKKRLRQRQVNTVKKIFGIVGILFVAFVYFQFGLGAAGIGIWLQAVPVFLAALSLAIGAYRIFRDRPAATLILWGTLPAWLFHIPATIIFDDESPVFVLVTGITPIIAGVILLLHRHKS
jgi:hypothetical protein